MTSVAKSPYAGYRFPGESVDHQPDQRPVAQARVTVHVDTVVELPGLVGRKHRGLAALHDMFRAARGGGRVEGQDAAGREPVEHHSDGGECCLTVGADWRCPRSSM